MYIRKASAAIDKTIVITWFLVFFDSYIKVFPTPCNKLTNIFSLWDECIYVCFTFSFEKNASMNPVLRQWIYMSPTKHNPKLTIVHHLNAIFEENT